MKVTYKCLPENEKGAFGVRFGWKKRVIFGVGSQELMGSFLMWIPRNGGHLVCKNATSSQKFANFMSKLPQNW